MKFKFRYVGLFILVLSVFFVLFVGCKSSDNKATLNCTITKIDEFGGAVLSISEADIEKCGIQMGDTVELNVANGRYFFKDIGYFDNYYEKIGAIELVAYPGTNEVCISSVSNDFNKHYPVIPGEPVEIKLQDKGAKIDFQNLGLVYSNNRSDFSSDEEFANFREVKVGKMGSKKLFRSVTPANNKWNRAEVTDALAEKNGINTVMNLCDNPRSLIGRVANNEVNVPYYKSLALNGHVICSQLPASIQSQAHFADEFCDMICEMSYLPTPYLVHCNEGKDRTGFVCVILESLMGANYYELQNDYMVTYKNLYGIDEKTKKKEYDIIVENKFDDMLYNGLNIDKNTDLTKCDFKECATKYLLEHGVVQKVIDKLITQLS